LQATIPAGGLEIRNQLLGNSSTFLRYVIEIPEIRKGAPGPQRMDALFEKCRVLKGMDALFEVGILRTEGRVPNRLQLPVVHTTSTIPTIPPNV
jgi:hypothetical protein